jgi:hypothetical protein
MADWMVAERAVSMVEQLESEKVALMAALLVKQTVVWTVAE